MKNNTCFWYLTQFFLEWKMFRQNHSKACDRADTKYALLQLPHKNTNQNYHDYAQLQNHEKWLLSSQCPSTSPPAHNDCAPIDGLSW
jgi:hypothetical protein